MVLAALSTLRPGALFAGARLIAVRRYCASVDSGPGRGKLRVLSRALLAVGLTALAALIIRLRGSGGTPPHRGGWRELSATDLEPVDKK
jgi:hypothetical protein